MPQIIKMKNDNEESNKASQIADTMQLDKNDYVEVIKLNPKTKRPGLKLNLNERRESNPN